MRAVRIQEGRGRENVAALIKSTATADAIALVGITASCIGPFTIPPCS